MSVRSLNGLGGSTNVYVNTNLSATEPVVVNQTSFNNPIVVSLKGLSGFGTAGQVIKVNSTANSLEYGSNNDYWTLSNNNLYPNSTSDRVVIGTTGSLNTSTALTIKNSNPGLSGVYTNGILDINNQDNGNQIYLACDKDQSNDIYFGDANSDVGGTDGVLLRQETDDFDNNVFKINSVSAGANTDRVNIDMPNTNDTFLKVQSSTNAYLELKENDGNRVDLRYGVNDGGTNLDTFKCVFYHQNDGNQSIFNYNHNPTASSRELLFFPITKFEDDVLIKHTGGGGTQSKLIFSNTTNTNQYSFEYSENTNVFNFSKNSSVLWEYFDGNSPATFTIFPVFKFGNTIFRNASNYEITLPTPTQNGEKLALISDITAANYWSLTSNTLKTAQTSYNILLGKSTASTGNPKLDILGNAVIDGDVSLTGTFKCEDHFAVNHSDPLTYIYDPTTYSTSNPFISYHTNGTNFQFNLPDNQGSSSSFRFLAGNSAELMRLDAGSNLKIFGTTNAKVEIENNGASNSTSTLDFTNSDNGDFYRFEYNYATSVFNFIHNHLGTDADTIWEFNDATIEFKINKDTIIRNDENIDAKLFITCSDSTGAEAKIIFGDFDTTSKYTLQYDYHVSTPAFELLDDDLNTIFRFTDNDDTFTFNNKVIHTSRFISLTGNSGQITNGSQFFTLPSSSGTLALLSDIGTNLFNVSGTTMVCDPQGNDSNITTEFKISSGAGDNGSCVLIIESDTNNQSGFESSRPKIQMRSDAGLTGGDIGFDSSNHMEITTLFSGTKIILNPQGDCDINATLTSCSSDFDCSTSRFKVSFDGSNYTKLFNPSGTSGANTTAGSHLNYHDNGTALALNVPNTSNAASNGNNIVFQSGGTNRMRVNGSTNPCVQLFQTNGTTIYFNQGRTSTFPTGMGGTWDSQSVPIGNAYFQGGTNTNDFEGFWFCQNGQTTACSSTADLQAFRWYNEDSISTGWYISSSGVISTFSDSRLKTEITDWKETDKEKYKKIRTIRYKEKIPDKINPKRLDKQSCIDHYNERHYGVIAQEIFELYPEIKNDFEVNEYNKWKHRKDNWNNGVYEKEHKEWEEAKHEYECCDQKDCETKSVFKTPEPQKEFNEEEPYLHLDYNRINLITIGVVQDLIKENETLRQEVNNLTNIINKLIESPSFKSFKQKLE
jgi:hypothetical protein|tara:strand:- start:1018 stop:4521 length:3504 start_codon:yes stop_codon:yes gene_type:complete